MGTLQEELQSLQDDLRGLNHRLRSAELSDSERADLLTQQRALREEIAGFNHSLQLAQDGNATDVIREEIEVLSRNVQTLQWIVQGHQALNAPGIQEIVRDLRLMVEGLDRRVRQLFVVLAIVVVIPLVSTIWNIILINQLLR